MRASNVELGTLRKSNARRSQMLRRKHIFKEGKEGTRAHSLIANTIFAVAVYFECPVITFELRAR